MNGLACIETHMTRYPNGWLVMVTSKILAQVMWILAQNLWAFFPKFIIGLQYFTLTKVKLNAKNATPPTTFLGWMLRVKVDRMTHGSAQTQFNLFFAKLD